MPLVKFRVDKCQHVPNNEHAPLLTLPSHSYCSQMSAVANRHRRQSPAPFYNLPPWSRPEPGQNGGRWTLGESGLGWGPLTNTQPNVLIDPMPSYFRTSVRRQGVARRDQQSASLKELEQGEEEEWREGGDGGRFTALYRGGQQEGRGHKFNCATQNDGIRRGGDV